MRVIVVGSGIVGASSAYTASSRGAEVLLVDAVLPGQATAAGAGIVCPWPSSMADDPVWYDLACASARFYPGLIAELANYGEVDLGYRRVGGLILTGSPAGNGSSVRRSVSPAVSYRPMRTSPRPRAARCHWK